MKKTATQVGSGQQIRVGLSVPTTDRQRLLELPLLRPHLIPVSAEKRPLTRAWEQPDRTYTDTVLHYAPAIGLRLGYPVLAVDFDPKPDNLSQAERTFEHRTGRSSVELPISWTITSGKPGRRQVLLQVDPGDVPRLNPWSRDGLEIRWRGQQSVIDGAHPETGRYQWLPGRAPWECQLATAPDWLLHGFKPTASKPVNYQPKRAPSYLDHWSAADWCRHYLRYWPASGLDARSQWWPTIVVMRRSGLTFEEAFAWSAASYKHSGGREFRRQWDKAERCSAPYTVEWLGARTRAARQQQGVRCG